MPDILQEICAVFNRQANKYDKAAKIQQEIGARLFERLEYIKLKPSYILDLGCGTGSFSLELKKLYPKAEIIGIDLAQNMLLESKAKQSLFKKWSLVSADMSSLPFADGFFDLVFANQSIHWAQDLTLLFKELNRVMKPESCLLFTTLGPSTFQELRSAWNKADSYAHTNDFLDMHDIGDCLLAARFADPVVDMELITLHYAELSKLVSNLKDQGVRNINSERKLGLTSRKNWLLFEEAYANLRTETGKYPLTYEVVYGHAWKAKPRISQNSSEILIPITDIRRNYQL